MQRLKLATAVLVLLAAGPTVQADNLDGVWLFDAATTAGKIDKTAFVWKSKLTVTGRTFALSRFMDLKADLKGTFAFDPAHPTHVDIASEGLDLSATGMPLKVPATTWLGLYKLAGDRLTVTFDRTPGRRPAKFNETGDTILSLKLVKAPADFKAFPKEVAVRVTTPDGKPADGVTVAGHMGAKGFSSQSETTTEWEYSDPVKTDADGMARVKPDALRSGVFVAHDPAGGRMALVAVTPATVAAGEVAVALRPECRVTMAVTCEGRPAKFDQPDGPVQTYVEWEGRRFAYRGSKDGSFAFALPPGEYTIQPYGNYVERKTFTVSVPADRKEFSAGPFDLPAARLVQLRGKPAPEFEGVVGWKGEPVKLAGLRGKYVLLEFWGYWCGPCVASMPVLLDLHEKFADKGVAIVGMHMDGEGEVDTAAKLDEKTAGFREKLWKGRDLPFPVALFSGTRIGEGDDRRPGGPAGQYGVRSWPTTVLIDREGNVVGKFNARDLKAATEQIEKLLDQK